MPIIEHTAPFSQAPDLLSPDLGEHSSTFSTPLHIPLLAPLWKDPDNRSLFHPSAVEGDVISSFSSVFLQ